MDVYEGRISVLSFQVCLTTIEVKELALKPQGYHMDLLGSGDHGYRCPHRHQVVSVPPASS